MKVLGKSYFTEYLPPKIFKNLKRDEKKNYREYRRWYRLLGDTKNDIDNKTNQIKKLKEEISELKYTLQDRKDKLDYFSIPINHLMDNFSFTCSITMRDKTSKSYKINNICSAEGCSDCRPFRLCAPSALCVHETAMS